MINVSLDCTGCNACVQKCPQNCISLKENKYGFLYPEIDTAKCISCGLCNKVCHLENYVKEDKNIPIAYAGVHNNKKTVLQSTSGGIFSAIAEKILSNGGIVYGCAYDENLKPMHTRVDNVKDLHSLYGSKYIQSEIGNSYINILNDLKENKTVFFAGTPCQVAGLKTFLVKDYDNLYTADLICHGVPSYAYFKKFIDWYEKKKKGKIIDFNFRSKDNSGWSLAGTYTLLKNQKEKVKKTFYFDSYYYHYFLNGEIYRDSCYNCKYANIYRTGDFTLGDFWGAEKFRPSLNIKKGCSLLLVSSAKGKNMLDSLDISLQEIPLDYAVKNNTQLHAPSKMTNNRKDILEEYCTCSASQMQKNYCKRYRTKRVIGQIKYLILAKIKKFLKK